LDTKIRRLEITTMHRCIIDCTFCPQAVYQQAYTQKTDLSLENFKRALAHTPKDVVIEFAGFSEPFLNSECLSMIQYADSEGYRIILDSTLTGLSQEDLKKLSAIDLLAFSLHLPDNKGNAKIPIDTQKYKDTLAACFSLMRVDCFSVMNDNFVSHGRAGNCKDAPKLNKHGKLVCRLNKFKYSQPVMLPNGDLVLCCMDYGLKNKLGNLFDCSYDALTTKIKQTELCKHCIYADSLIKSFTRKLFHIILNIDASIS